MDERKYRNTLVPCHMRSRFFIQFPFKRILHGRSASMARLLHPGHPANFDAVRVYVLALTWLSGFLLGIVFACHFRPALPEWRAYILDIRETHAFFVLLPIALSFFVVLAGWPDFLLGICFGKAVCFSFVSAMTVAALGSCGWAIRWPLLFSQIAVLPMLYFFWLRHYCYRKKVTVFEAVICSAYYLYIEYVRASLVEPLLRRLLY